MNKEELQKAELSKLIDRVIVLKNHLYGEGNWKKSLLPRNIGECKTFIKYCNENYGVIG